MDMILTSSSILIKLTEYLTKKDEKRIVLSPMNVIYRLALLSFCPETTKMSIMNNGIRFMYPSIFQPILRWKNNDTRDDIHNLHNAIVKFVLWYDNKDVDMLYICSRSLEGLKHLQKTYAEHSIISHCIVLYQNLLAAFMRGERMISPIPIKETYSSDKIIDEYMRNQWTDRQKTLGTNLLREIETMGRGNESSYFESLEKLVDLKEQELNLYIKKIVSPDSSPALISTSSVETVPPLICMPPGASGPVAQKVKPRGDGRDRSDGRGEHS